METNAIRELEGSRTTDAQITSHLAADAYGRTYRFYRCQACGTEATRRSALAQAGCGCH